MEAFSGISVGFSSSGDGRVDLKFAAEEECGFCSDGSFGSRKLRISDLESCY
jgi:hypothetical protein